MLDLNANFRKPRPASAYPLTIEKKRKGVVLAQRALESKGPADEVVIRGGSRAERGQLVFKHVVHQQDHNQILDLHHTPPFQAKGTPTSDRDDGTALLEKHDKSFQNGVIVLLHEPENFSSTLQQNLAKSIQQNPDSQFIALLDSDKEMEPSLQRALGQEQNEIDLDYEPPRFNIADNRSLDINRHYR